MARRNTKLRSVILLTLASFLSLANPTLSSAEVDAFGIDSADVHAAQAALRASFRPADSEISPQVGSAISRLKISLEKFVRAYVQTIPVNAALDTNKVEADLTSRAQAGMLRGFEISVTPDARRLFQIKIAFAVPCGEDSLLLIFEPENGRWKEVVNLKSERVESRSGGLNLLSYRISPPDSDGGWYLLASYTPARCSSCWGNIKYLALRPAEQSTSPKLLLKEWGPSYDCDEGPTSMTAEVESFELRFDGNSIDTEVLIRRHVRRYQIREDMVVRVQPVSENARDFIDEWITSPWESAKRWCDTEKQAALKAAHERLHQIEKRSKLKFGAMESDGTASDLINRVELWEDEYEDPNDAPSWNFIVKGRRDHFSMVSVSSSPG